MNFKKLLYLSSCLLMHFLTAAQENNKEIITPILKNVTYKVTNQSDSIKLDIYQPSKKKYSKTPVVVFIHGGAWAKGDKDFKTNYYMRSLKDTLQTNGYAVVSINYRLVSKKNNLSKQVSDCRDALTWIKQHAEEYNFDSENIGLWGESAGAHLALMIGYTDGLSGQPTFKSDYIIDNFGPTDLNKILKTNASFFTRTIYKLIFPKLYDLREKLIVAMTTYDINTDKEKAVAVAKKYSPIEHLSVAHKIPTLILHGTKDFIVPFKQSKRLRNGLIKNEIKNDLIKVKKGNHGFRNISDSEIQSLISKTLQFIQQHTD